MAMILYGWRKQTLILTIHRGSANVIMDHPTALSEARYTSNGRATIGEEGRVWPRLLKRVDEAMILCRWKVRESKH